MQRGYFKIVHRIQLKTVLRAKIILPSKTHHVLAYDLFRASCVLFMYEDVYYVRAYLRLKLISFKGNLAPPHLGFRLCFQLENNRSIKKRYEQIFGVSVQISFLVHITPKLSGVRRGQGKGAVLPLKRSLPSNGRICIYVFFFLYFSRFNCNKLANQDVLS